MDMLGLQRELFTGRTSDGQARRDAWLLEKWPVWIQWSRTGSHPEAHAALALRMAATARAPSSSWRESLGVLDDRTTAGRRLSKAEAELIQGRMAMPRDPVDCEALSRQMEAGLILLTELVRDSQRKRRRQEQTEAEEAPPECKRSRGEQDEPAEAARAAASLASTEEVPRPETVVAADTHLEPAAQRDLGETPSSHQKEAPPLAETSEKQEELSSSAEGGLASSAAETAAEERAPPLEAATIAHPTAPPVAAQVTMQAAAGPPWGEQASAEVAPPSTELTRVTLQVFLSEEAEVSGVPSKENVFDVHVATMTVGELLAMWKQQYALPDGSGVELEVNGKVVASEERLVAAFQGTTEPRSLVVVPIS